MAIEIGKLVVSTSTPSGYLSTDPSHADWVWLNPDTGVLKRYNTGTGAFDIVIPTASHNHETLGDIEFTGTIAVDGYDGIGERVTIGDKKLTFKQGICVLVEDV